MTCFACSKMPGHTHLLPNGALGEAVDLGIWGRLTLSDFVDIIQYLKRTTDPWKPLAGCPE